jgi:hypothetical protein
MLEKAVSGDFSSLDKVFMNNFSKNFFRGVKNSANKDSKLNILHFVNNNIARIFNMISKKEKSCAHFIFFFREKGKSIFGGSRNPPFLCEIILKKSEGFLGGFIMLAFIKKQKKLFFI